MGIPREVVSGRIVLGWRFIEQALHEALGRTLAGQLNDWPVAAGAASGAGLSGALEVAIDEHLTRLAVAARLAT